MFNEIPVNVLGRMRELEGIHSGDRHDNTPHMERLRQIPPEVGKFIALLAASTPAGCWIEIGTSAGYSALWLSLACRAVGRKLRTFEISKAKAELALQTFAVAGVTDVVDLVRGDALEHLSDCKDISFCFLDAEKEIYEGCYEAVVPAMVPGGILVADNAISHRAALQPMLDKALCDDRVDALVLPIGNGELVCRRK